MCHLPRVQLYEFLGPLSKSAIAVGWAPRAHPTDSFSVVQVLQLAQAAALETVQAVGHERSVLRVPGDMGSEESAHRTVLRRKSFMRESA